MSIRAEIRLSWRLGVGDAPTDLNPTVLKILRAIGEGNHLGRAAKNAGVSYRHAWGLLREWESRLGAALVATNPGRGARLTALGQCLIEVDAESHERSGELLEALSLEASARLCDAAAPRIHPLHIVSSHSERLQALREALDTRYRVQFELAGSETALETYRLGQADVAGFHLPMADWARPVAARLIDALDAKRDAISLVECRRLGLMSRKDLSCRSMAELVDRKLRFVNRQKGSGTRLIFDHLLDNNGYTRGDINGYHNEEYTHTAIAALVATGAADVGFGDAQAAAALSLDFAALLDERFYLAMRVDADSAQRRAVESFCDEATRGLHRGFKKDEFRPTVAVLKRVHRAGFWK